jgi:ABC-type multidrug transport system permease subunit
LFEQFDRLLFLRKGGKTVYFGNVGANSRTLLEYFERNGARKCDSEENPAEYMLEVANDSNADWHEIWKNSSEAGGIQQEIDQIHQETAARNVNDDDPSAHSEFAMPFTTQLYEVTYRVFQQYWRMPSYVAAKMVLAGAAGLFIGFSFYNANASLQGMQNVVYSLFMVTTIFSTLVQQIMPLFVTQRSLYEVRERPSKAYSWAAFLTANVVVEIPYQIVAALIIYATFYYPVVGIQSSERQGLVLLFLVIFFIYASTFAHMCIAALPDAQTAGAIVTLLFSMSLIFNGVMQPPSALPGFWIFMYRVSPLTYWVSGMASTLLHGRAVTCSEAELNIFQPPSGQTCGAYLQPYLSQAPGYLQNPQATSDCSYCSLRIADTFLAGSGIYWSDRWRNFGLIWVYVFFNIFVAVLTYYLFRVRPSKQASKTKKAKKGSKAVAQSGGTTEEKPKPPEDDLSDSEEPNSLRRRKSITDANISRTNTAGSGAVDYGLTTVRSVMSNYLTQNLQRTQSNTRNMQVY